VVTCGVDTSARFPPSDDGVCTFLTSALVIRQVQPWTAVWIMATQETTNETQSPFQFLLPIGSLTARVAPTSSPWMGSQRSAQRLTASTFYGEPEPPG